MGMDFDATVLFVFHSHGEEKSAQFFDDSRHLRRDLMLKGYVVKDLFLSFIKVDNQKNKLLEHEIETEVPLALVFWGTYSSTILFVRRYEIPFFFVEESFVPGCFSFNQNYFFNHSFLIQKPLFLESLQVTDKDLSLASKTLSEHRSHLAVRNENSSSSKRKILLVHQPKQYHRSYELKCFLLKIKSCLKSSDFDVVWLHGHKLDFMEYLQIVEHLGFKPKEVKPFEISSLDTYDSNQTFFISSDSKALLRALFNQIPSSDLKYESENLDRLLPLSFSNFRGWLQGRLSLENPEASEAFLHFLAKAMKYCEIPFDPSQYELCSRPQGALLRRVIVGIRENASMIQKTTHFISAYREKVRSFFSP